MSKAAQTRHNLLWAAVEIIMEGGMDSFTLEAVAQQAGISKGGLLHHFPNKVALLEGVVQLADETWMQRFDEQIANEAEDTPGR